MKLDITWFQPPTKLKQAQFNYSVGFHGNLEAMFGEKRWYSSVPHSIAFLHSKPLFFYRVFQSNILQSVNHYSQFSFCLIRCSCEVAITTRARWCKFNSSLNRAELKRRISAKMSALGFQGFTVISKELKNYGTVALNKYVNNPHRLFSVNTGLRFCINESELAKNLRELWKSGWYAVFWLLLIHIIFPQASSRLDCWYSERIAIGYSIIQTNANKLLLNRMQNPAFSPLFPGTHLYEGTSKEMTKVNMNK